MSLAEWMNSVTPMTCEQGTDRDGHPRRGSGRGTGADLSSGRYGAPGLQFAATGGVAVRAGDA